jgi:hypothetical protein
MARKFSPAQLRYMEARAAFDVAYQAHRAHEKLMDEEGERLGIPGPFAILPDGHPMWVDGQRLLDIENAMRREMHAAANAMFDWALDATFLSVGGTPEQTREIRASFEKIKKMAHVEKFWIEAVDLTLKLNAR